MVETLLVLGIAFLLLAGMAVYWRRKSAARHAAEPKPGGVRREVSDRETSRRM